MITDPSNPEYNAKARDAVMDLCLFYDPNHKCGIVREHVFKGCLTELRERERLALESAKRQDALSSAGMTKILRMESVLKNLLSIKAAKDAQGDSPAYRAAKNLAWKKAEELVGPQPIRADLDCPRRSTLASESQREAAETADEKPDGQAENKNRHRQKQTESDGEHNQDGCTSRVLFGRVDGPPIGLEVRRQVRNHARELGPTSGAFHRLPKIVRGNLIQSSAVRAGRWFHSNTAYRISLETSSPNQS